MALLISAARKVESELGASVVWGEQSASLRVPALDATGDPRRLQIAGLGSSVEGFLDELVAAAPAEPHVAILFGTVGEADDRVLAAGYTLVEVMPVMVVSLATERSADDDTIIEPASVADADELVALDERSSVYRFDDRWCSTLVARVDGRIVGKAQLVEAVPGVGYLTDMVVDKAHRRAGIGGALVAAAESRAQSTGAEHMLLASTEMGRLLYGSLGYEVDCWLQSYVRVTNT